MNTTIDTKVICGIVSFMRHPFPLQMNGKYNYFCASSMQSVHKLCQYVWLMIIKDIDIASELRRARTYVVYSYIARSCSIWPKHRLYRLRSPLYNLDYVLSLSSSSQVLLPFSHTYVASYSYVCIAIATRVVEANNLSLFKSKIGFPLKCYGIWTISYKGR